MPSWCSNGVLRPWIGRERKAVFGKPFLFLGGRDDTEMRVCGQAHYGINLSHED